MWGYADGHCDTIVKLLEEKKRLFRNDEQLDIEKMQTYAAPVQVFAIWLDPKYYSSAMRQTMKYIKFYYSEIEGNSEFIGHVNSFADILQNRREKKISALLALEGGEALEGEISALHIYHRLGVRLITLTWNHRNQLADGVAETGGRGGLTNFGRQVIREMERLGMIVDVSHLSETGFWDVAEIAVKPFIASHSNAKTICDVPRNLSDEQLRAIAQNGGVVGINLYAPFLAADREADIEDILRHIYHIISIVGEDGIAMGSDLDGTDHLPIGISNVLDVKRIFERVEKEFGIRVAQKFASENLLRVINQVL
ncbi:membrane dipeptidase (peptidase family M19) [Anaerotignum neopropionicum]|uniref:Membrane dipeptidase (Peptidase family M19) n=1 Tax=Anaerotignum neopropionicum TaxID=36847 RepID=A0A136WDV5_9FIRM|nr:dipeptidase [Anaerotignum neopropionicum]KXL52519.1 membrane dipeptidase (peptidase family M19) [Anaerotignum neopropionicum]